jgi:hypothetical protein
MTQLFGTDGVRGKAGDAPLDVPTIRRLGAALVRVLRPALSERSESNGSRVEQVVTRVGRVPLFFYLWQWPLAHGLAVLLSVATGKAIGYYFMNPPAVFAAMPPDAGFDLPIVYLCWAAIIAVLIPMCLWFARVKASNPAWWLKYL